MPSDPVKSGIVEQSPSMRFLPFAIMVIAMDGIMAGIPVINYILGLLALAAYPTLFWTLSRGKVFLIAVLTLTAASLFSGLSGTLSLAFSITLPGIILGASMLKRRSPGKAITFAFLPSLVVVILFLFNRSEIEAGFYLVAKQAFSNLGAVPGFISEKGDISKAMQSYLEVVFTLMPSFILLSGVFNVSLAYFAAQKLLQRSGFQAPSLPKFSTWRPGFKLVWIFIAGLLLTVFQIGGSEYAGWNILVFTGIIYFVSGLAVVESFFVKSKMPFIFKLLFYMGIFFAQLFSLVVLAGVGLFDCWFNFRHRRIDKAV